MNKRELPESDHETATGRQLYTIAAIRKAYAMGVADCTDAAKEWGKSGGDYSLLDVFKELEKKTLL